METNQEKSNDFTNYCRSLKKIYTEVTTYEKY